MEDRFDFDDLKGNKLLPGLILVGVGVLALVGNFGLNLFGNVLGALLFGGLAYYLYSEGRRTGRAAMRFAALPVAGLALAALLPGRTGGALFLALIGLAFAVVWRADRRRWWAIIPAGTMASLAAVAGLGDLLGRADGFVFLGGLALTFYALTRLPVQPQAWAIWPAGGLGVLALMSLMDGGGWLLPILLIGGGAVLLTRGGFGRRPATAAPAPVVPTAPGSQDQQIVRAEGAGVSDVPAAPAAPTPPATTGASGAPAPTGQGHDAPLPPERPEEPQGPRD